MVYTVYTCSFFNGLPNSCRIFEPVTWVLDLTPSSMPFRSVPRIVGDAKDGQVLGSKELNSRNSAAPACAGRPRCRRWCLTPQPAPVVGHRRNHQTTCFSYLFLGKSWEIMGNHGKSWEIMGKSSDTPCSAAMFARGQAIPR